MEICTLAQRPELAAALRDEALEPGPEFIYHDTVSGQLWPRLAADFPDYQLLLIDGDRVVGKAHSIPLHWNASDAELPAKGWEFALRQGCADADADRPPTVASALAAVVAKDRLGSGLSTELVQGMRRIAAERGLAALLAPVRPTFKARYPLNPMADYITWTLPDGRTPFDPWIRVHWRLGGRILHPCPESMTVTGSVADWEKWTGLAMPGSGDYIVADALVPVRVDRERGTACYVEPNVWMRHDL